MYNLFIFIDWFHWTENSNRVPRWGITNHCKINMTSIRMDEDVVRWYIREASRFRKKTCGKLKALTGACWRTRLKCSIIWTWSWVWSTESKICLTTVLNIFSIFIDIFDWIESPIHHQMWGITSHHCKINMISIRLDEEAQIRLHLQKGFQICEYWRFKLLVRDCWL